MTFASIPTPFPTNLAPTTMNAFALPPPTAPTRVVLSTTMHTVYAVQQRARLPPATIATACTINVQPRPLPRAHLPMVRLQVRSRVFVGQSHAIR